MIPLQISDSRLDCFRSLKGRDGLDHNQIIIESEKVIEKFLLCGQAGLTLLSTPQWANRPTFDVASFENHFLLDQSDMASLVGYRYHQGVIATANLPKSSDLSEFEGDTLVLNGVSSPENVGALIRSACGLGFKNILFDHETCHPFIRRAIRVSMGNIFFMRWHHTHHLQQSIRNLQNLNYRVFGGANESDSILLTQLKWPDQNCAIVIGSEGHGMAKNIKQSCDQIIKIPMMEKVAHLNAAGAGAILMYDRFRSQLS